MVHKRKLHLIRYNIEIIYVCVYIERGREREKENVKRHIFAKVQILMLEESAQS